jgi:hypothetical protein
MLAWAHAWAGPGLARRYRPTAREPGLYLVGNDFGALLLHIDIFAAPRHALSMLRT